jgi:phosphoserine aminotransferase
MSATRDELKARIRELVESRDHHRAEAQALRAALDAAPYRQRVIHRHNADRQALADLMAIEHNMQVALAPGLPQVQRDRALLNLMDQTASMKERLVMWQRKGLEAIREAAKQNGTPPVVATEPKGENP